MTLLCFLTAACHDGSRPPLRLGTTYTVQQSGALAVLESLWTAPPLATVIGPSGQMLRAAANGDLDVVITHAPPLEERLLVAPGHALQRCPLVASRFAVVGPPADPARVASAATAVEAFRRIARAGGPFVSRGDSSGTHVKELALWQATGVGVGVGVQPAGAWYLESGADQATTLHLADERDAYALADLPTYAKLTDLRLRVLFAADTALTNPYTLYVVRRPAPHPLAREFAAWAVSAGRQGILALRLPDGTPAFVTRAGECTAPPATRSPAAPSAAVLLGRWDYVAPPPPRPRPRPRSPTRPTLGAGLQLTLEFDSLMGRTAHGRVRRWFAGDVGARPAAFGPVTAELGDSDRVTITITAAARVAVIRVVATRVGSDTLAIVHAAQGNTAGPPRPGALLVRARESR